MNLPVIQGAITGEVDPPDTVRMINKPFNNRVMICMQHETGIGRYRLFDLID